LEEVKALEPPNAKDIPEASCPSFKDIKKTCSQYNETRSWVFMKKTESIDSGWVFA
jgi:hypothetical protein